MTGKYGDVCGKKWRFDWCLISLGYILMNRHFLPFLTTDTVSSRSDSEGSHKASTVFFIEHCRHSYKINTGK
jgi:hypothetical protein